MNLFLTSNRSLHADKTCSLPGRHMEYNRFCPHPELFGKIVPYTTCAKCSFNTGKTTNGMFNSVKFMEDMLPDSIMALVDTPQDTINAIKEYKPDAVIIEALIVDPSLLADLIKTYPAKYIVRVHSKVPFIGSENGAIEKIFQYHKEGAIISPNNYETYEDFIGIGLPCVYLPNIYHIKPSNNFVKIPISAIDIGCFGAFRWFKNHLQQAFCAIEFARSKNLQLNFHINASRTETGGEANLSNIRSLFKNTTRAKLIEQPWLDHDDFLEKVRGLHIGMQFSMTESFNIVTADYISQNIPVAVSDEIKFVDPKFKANPIDSRGIIRALENAFASIQTGEHHINRTLLEQHNSEAIRIWKDFLDVSQST